MSNTTITPTVGAITLAGVAPTPAQAYVPGQVNEGQGAQMTLQWNALPNGGAGQPSLVAQWRSAFFQVTGTFGSGGSVQMEGSNDGTNWVKLSPTALVAAGLFAALGVNERPRFIRPHVTAGDGTTSLNIAGCFAQ